MLGTHLLSTNNSSCCTAGCSSSNCCPDCRRSCRRPPGSFCGLRLLAGEPLEEVAPALRRRLAEAVLADPPYELGWLKDAQCKVGGCELARVHPS